MSELDRYRKKDSTFVVAVQLDLDTEGFTYNKWGAVQRCKPGDWLVNNNGDIYTVDGDVFRNTYREEIPGRYVKKTPVWAKVAEKHGVIETKEGASHFNRGDYIVYNNEDETDGYCMSASKFNSMYELDERDE